MFNFDYFINKPCAEIFGHNATYIPANSIFAPFTIKGDLHIDYQWIKPDSSDTEISSSSIVIFVRDAAMSSSYPKANPGDFIEVGSVRYQIIDIQPHIPGSKGLILHEFTA